MKNRFLTMIGIILITMTSLHAQSQSIADEWESSPQYKEYLTYMEAGNLESAIKVKKEKVDTITLRVMKPYLNNIKEKYREKYANKLCDNLPIKLIELLNMSFFKAQDILEISDIGDRHYLAKTFYMFFLAYYKEEGKAEMFLSRITKNFSKLKNTELMNKLEVMAKESDTEANKTPEQKQAEHEAWMAKKAASIAKSQRSIDEWNELIKELSNFIK